TTGLGVGFASTGGALTTFGTSAFFTCSIFSTFFGGGGSGLSTILTSFGLGGSFCGSAFGFGGKGFGGKGFGASWSFTKRTFKGCLSMGVSSGAFIWLIAYNTPTCPTSTAATI